MTTRQRSNRSAASWNTRATGPAVLELLDHAPTAMILSTRARRADSNEASPEDTGWPRLAAADLQKRVGDIEAIRALTDRHRARLAE